MGDGSTIWQLGDQAPARSGPDRVAEARPVVDVAADLLAAKEALKARMGDPLGRAARLGPVPQGVVNQIGPGNIVGLAIGPKSVAGQRIGTPAVQVLVVRKASAAKVPGELLVPAEVGGVATDVVEVGLIRPFGFTDRQRPAQGGSSVGHYEITAGTLGALVVLENRKLCILSNNHVLAAVNQGVLADNILQPGVVDGGVNPGDRIGHLEDFVPLNFSGPNQVDAAVAWTNFRLASPQHRTFTINPAPAAASLGLAVRKDGRTTGETTGAIVSVAADLNVNYAPEGGVATFSGQVRIQSAGEAPFSQPGDSGSLIVTANGLQPVALLFSGGGLDTFATPIGAVMDALKINRFLAAVE